MYGVMSAVGMLAALVLLAATRKHTRFSEDQALSAALWAIISGFLGAKVLFWLVEIDHIIADPGFLLRTLREGFVFYGALIGGLGGVAIYALRKKLPFFSLTDFFIPALVIGHAFGRIGCLFAGCCYGMECDLPISIVFPAGSAAPAGIPLLPTQVMESAFLFLLCAFLVWRLTKKKPFGTISGWYMVLYGAWRFVIEFFRNDERGAVGVLSTSQFISVFIIAGGIALLLLVKCGVLKKTVLDLPIPVEEEPKKKQDKAEAAAVTAEPTGKAKAEETNVEEKPEEKK
jgi:phosphatidylglycerol:prolipoprotein diacylglycerol transferase